MAQESFEKKITEALHRGTDEASAMQEKNWKLIKEKIHGKEGYGLTKSTFQWKRALGIGAVAVAMVFVLSMFSQPGQAALERIRKYFEPEKIVGYEVEGEEEDIDSRLQQGAMGYVMYYDQERYKVVEDGQIDRIVMREAAEDVPEVYLEVSQDLERAPEELAAELEAALKAGFSKVDSPKEVADPLQAIYIHAIDGGAKWDDPVVNYYLIDNTKGGSFVIKTKYFLEAAEGHGARFHAMLKEFTIVPEE
jgi:hypothetical protein